MLTSAIVSRVQTAFGDSNQVMIFESHIIDWVNEGCLEIVRETQCLTKTDSVSAASAYRPPGKTIADMILLKRVYYGTIPLALLEVETIDRMGIRNLPEGVPQGYYMDGPTILLFPVPKTTDTTFITVHYVPEPTTVTNVATPPPIPNYYHGDLADWCLAKAHERNENYRASELIMQRFKQNISKRRYESLSQDDSFKTVQPDIMDSDFVFGYDYS